MAIKYTKWNIEKTKSEWLVSRDNGFGVNAVIAKIPIVDGDHGFTARLIASAPQLLETCIMMEEFLADQYELDGMDARKHPLIKLLREVISVVRKRSN